LRQTTGFAESLLERIGRCPTSAPCVVHYPADDLHRKSAERGPESIISCHSVQGIVVAVHLLVESTGIKAEGEGEWNPCKQGGSKRRLWRKIHIGIDEETQEIRAIEVTSSGIGDTPMLQDLLNQIPPEQDLGSFTAPSHALPGSEWCLRHAKMP